MTQVSSKFDDRGEEDTSIVLCAGNSCRRQMAEGFARQMGAGVIEAYSAGRHPAGIQFPRGSSDEGDGN